MSRRMPPRPCGSPSPAVGIGKRFGRWRRAELPFLRAHFGDIDGDRAARVIPGSVGISFSAARPVRPSADTLTLQATVQARPGLVRGRRRQGVETVI